MATLVDRITLLAESVRTKINLMVPRLIPAGGATGHALRKASAANYDVVWADPDPWTYIKLAADVTSSSTTTSDVSGFGFTPVASKTYLVEGLLLVRTSSALFGPRPGVAFPTGLTEGAANLLYYPDSGGTQLTYTSASLGASVQVASTLTATTGVSWPARVAATFTTGASPSGQCRVIFASSALGTVTMKAGSYLRYRTI